MQAAVIADDEDVQIDDNESFQSFNEEHLSPEFGDANDFTFDQQEMDDLEKLEMSEAQIDADLDETYLEAQNKEFVQVMEYDRAFLTKGPVVKIYKNHES